MNPTAKAIAQYLEAVAMMYGDAARDMILAIQDSPALARELGGVVQLNINIVSLVRGLAKQVEEREWPR